MQRGAKAASVLLAKTGGRARPATISALHAELTTWRRRAVAFWTSVAAVALAGVSLLLVPSVSLWSALALLSVVRVQALLAWLLCTAAEVFPVAPTSMLDARRAMTWVGLWVASFAVFVASCSAFSPEEGEGRPGLALFTPCKETRALDLTVRSVYCLHEPALAQYIAAGALATVLVASHWRRRRYLLRFPALQQQRWFRVKGGLCGVLRTTLALVFWSVVCFYGAYFLWGTWVSAWAASLTSALLQRPVYVFPSLWNDNSGYFPLASLFTTAGLVTTLSWYLASLLTHVIYTQRVSFDPECEGKHRLLLEGLQESKDTYTKHLAFLDLWTVSEIDRERRLQLFNDVGEEPALPTALKACCAVLDRFTIDLQAATLTEMERAEKKRNFVQRTKERLQRLLQPSKRPEAIFDRRQLVEWAALALANLVAQSLVEDRYGLVQSNKSIPVALNSLVSCLVTVKQHEQAIAQGLTARGLDSPPSRPAATAEALTTAVYRITATFHSYLAEYEFPEALVPSLQAFVAFQI